MYVYFVDDKMRLVDDLNLRYIDEINVYIIIFIRGYFILNLRVINYNIILEDFIFDRFVKGDFFRL